MSGFAGWAGGLHTHDEIKRQLALMATQFMPRSVQQTAYLPGGAFIADTLDAKVYQEGTAAIVLLGDIFWYHKHTKQSNPVPIEEILNTYLHQGAQCLNTFKGQFALCIIEGEHHEVFLASDRLGTYPLYYSEAKEHFVFGSSCKTILRHMAIHAELDPQALYNYLYFHFIPGPSTLYKNIKRIEPGHYILHRKSKTLSIPYWKAASFPKKTTQSHAKEELKSLLMQSVKPYEDRATGAFLSGGLDSSTIVGMMSCVYDKPIQAFTIGFDQDHYDESSYAALTAKHFKAEHHHRNLTSRDLFQALPEIVSHLEQPFGNASLIGAYFCSQMAHHHGVQMLLAGDGGDELFGGNSRYLSHFWFNQYHKVPKLLRKGLLEFWLSFVSNNPTLPIIRKLKGFIRTAQCPVPLRDQMHNLLNHLEIQKLLKPEIIEKIDPLDPAHLLTTSYRESQGKSWLNKIFCMDLKWILADNDLMKVRTACTMNQIQVRFPLLDEDLVHFASQLPDHYKIKQGTLRPFFKRALQDFLPREVLKKQKHGFGVPIGHWILQNKALKAYAFDTLNEFKRRDVLHTPFIDHLKDTLLVEHPGYYGVMAWLLIILELWLQTNQSSITPLDANQFLLKQYEVS